MLKNALWLFSIALLILIIFLPSYSRMQDLKQRNVEIEQQIEDLKRKNKEMIEERRLLEEDPVSLERVAREKMKLIREGEVIYRLPLNTED